MMIVMMTMMVVTIETHLQLVASQTWSVGSYFWDHMQEPTCWPLSIIMFCWNTLYFLQVTLISHSMWVLKVVLVCTVGNLALKVMSVPHICLWYLCPMDSCIKVCRIILKISFPKLFSRSDLRFWTPLTPNILCCNAECLEFCIVSGDALWDEDERQQWTAIKDNSQDLNWTLPRCESYAELLLHRD